MLKPIRSFVVRQIVQLLCLMPMVNFVIRCALGLHRFRLFAFHKDTPLRLRCLVLSRFNFIKYSLVPLICTLLQGHLDCFVNKIPVKQREFIGRAHLVLHYIIDQGLLLVHLLVIFACPPLLTNCIRSRV